jgi:cell division transport system permease protein
MRITYLFKQAFHGLSKKWSVNLILVFSFASSFLVFNIFLLITHNLHGVAQKLRGRVQVEVYLNEGITSEQISSLGKIIRNFPEVEKMEYRSKEEAFIQMENYLGKDLLEGLDSNSLPASFLVSLKKEDRGFQPIALVASKARKQEGVGDVEFGGEWLKKLDQALFIFFLVDLIFGIFITLAVTLIVSNFMRILVLSQTESIRIMSLLGASQKDIAFPFLIQGFILGGVGAVLGLLLIWASYSIFSTRIIAIAFLPLYMIGGLIIWGMLLGAGGGFLSIRKHL